MSRQINNLIATKEFIMYEASDSKVTKLYLELMKKFDKDMHSAMSINKRTI